MAAGSGASGALLSGIVLNAAFFGLSRGLLDWLPDGNADAAAGLGTFLLIVSVISAILTALYAFQEEDWRSLLSFSSAENASVAAAMLGAALTFRGDGQRELASLAWTVALLHLAAHALAKGGLFLTADGVYRATGGYNIFHSDLLRRSSWVFGFGALFAAMSLAAMPPQAGFVSEWYVFQTVFQGFHLGTVADRLAMALAGRRPGAHGRGCLCDLRQGFRHWTAWTLVAIGGSRFGRERDRRWLARPCGAHARRGDAGVARFAARCRGDHVRHAGCHRNARRCDPGAADGEVCLYLADPPCGRDAAARRSSDLR